MTQGPEIPPETAEVAPAIAKIFATPDAEPAHKCWSPSPPTTSSPRAWSSAGATPGFLGFPPSGHEVRVRHLHFYRVAEGQAVEHWGARDELALMRQIGVLPETSAATPADAAAAQAG